MKFSVNTNSFRKTHTIAQIVDLVKTTGADGIEWGLNSLDTATTDAQEMQKRTIDSGLEVLSFINGGRLWKTDEIRRWSEAIAQAGGKILRVAHPWYAWDYQESLHQKLSYNDLLELSQEGLAKLVPLSKEYGIRYVLETHRGSCFASPLAVKLIMADLDPKCCGVIYDPANTFVEGSIRPRGAIEVMGNYLAYVHAKNLRFTENSTGEMTYEKCPMNQGVVNYEEVMFALKLSGYDGWFSLEEFYSDSDKVRAEIVNGIAHLKAMAIKAPDKTSEPYITFND